MDIALKHWHCPERPLLGVQHEKKEKQTFSSTFWEAALLLDGFLRDMDLRNQSCFSRKLNIRASYPSLHGALRTT